MESSIIYKFINIILITRNSSTSPHDLYLESTVRSGEEDKFSDVIIMN